MDWTSSSGIAGSGVGSGSRRLANGAEPTVPWENDKPTVVALREIAAGNITAEMLREPEPPPVENTMTLDGDVARSDLAQGHDCGLVVLPAQRGLGTIRQPARALGGQQHELEQVIDVVQAVFDGDTGHK